MWEGIDEPLPEGNWPLLSASPLPYFPHSQVPREMDRRDMDLVRDQFVRAARMAEAAGFDMLELHMAHGYLLASFISPLTTCGRTPTGGRSSTACAIRSRCSTPCGRPGRRRSRSRSRSRRRTGPRGDDRRRRRPDRGDAQGAWLRHRHRLDRPDGGRPAARLRAPLPDPVQRPDPPRGGHPDDDRRATSRPTRTPTRSWPPAGRTSASSPAATCYDPYWTRHAAREQGYDLPWPDQYVSVQSYSPRQR